MQFIYCNQPNDENVQRRLVHFFLNTKLKMYTCFWFISNPNWLPNKYKYGVVLKPKNILN